MNLSKLIKPIVPEYMRLTHALKRTSARLPGVKLRAEGGGGLYLELQEGANTKLAARTVPLDDLLGPLSSGEPRKGPKLAIDLDKEGSPIGVEIKPDVTETNVGQAPGMHDPYGAPPPDGFGPPGGDPYGAPPDGGFGPPGGDPYGGGPPPGGGFGPPPGGGFGPPPGGGFGPPPGGGFGPPPGGGFGPPPGGGFGY
ncbi:MAG: hypothetical protein AAF355_08955 [Myxococcota bacterium]